MNIYTYYTYIALLCISLISLRSYALAPKKEFEISSHYITQELDEFKRFLSTIETQVSYCSWMPTWLFKFTDTVSGVFSKYEVTQADLEAVKILLADKNKVSETIKGLLHEPTEQEHLKIIFDNITHTCCPKEFRKLLNSCKENVKNNNDQRLMTNLFASYIFEHEKHISK